LGDGGEAAGLVGHGNEGGGGGVWLGSEVGGVCVCRWKEVCSRYIGIVFGSN
jgi:hypothetical protein